MKEVGQVMKYFKPKKEGGIFFFFFEIPEFGYLKEIEKYKKKRAIGRREVQKRDRDRWKHFTSQLETDITRTHPKTFKMSKRLKRKCYNRNC